MTIRIGIDLGGSTTKLIAVHPGSQIVAETQLAALRSPVKLDAALSHFLASHCGNQTVSGIALTGVGSSFIEDRPGWLKIDEMQAVGRGAQALAKQRDILAVSMGTGTALVRADHEKISHIGGTGVGGGTLAGLALRLNGTAALADFIELAGSGNLKNVDLKVGDLTRDETQSLTADLTAANLGKLNSIGSPADQAAGVINMILETIGVMAILALRRDTTQTIVLTGALTALPQAKPLYERMSQIYNVNFLIPTHAVYAAALGAVLAIP